MRGPAWRCSQEAKEADIVSNRYTLNAASARITKLSIELEKLKEQKGKENPVVNNITPPPVASRGKDGLKVKYDVYKIDDGKMVNNCFVLRPDKDPAAIVALYAYAATTTNINLADDIYNWIGKPKMGTVNKSCSTRE